MHFSKLIKFLSGNLPFPKMVFEFLAWFDVLRAFVGYFLCVLFCAKDFRYRKDQIFTVLPFKSSYCVHSEVKRKEGTNVYSIQKPLAVGENQNQSKGFPRKLGKDRRAVGQNP